MKTTLALLLLALALAGCDMPDHEPHRATVSVQYIGQSLRRFTDQEAGVVCWVIVRGEGTGISCLPIVETRLTK